MKPSADEPGFSGGALAELSMSQRVSAARAALADALAREDWEAVAELDVECRTCVDAVLSEPGVDRERVREDLEGLLELYRSLVADVSEARQAIAREMSEYRKTTSQAKVYSMFSGSRR